VISRLDLHRYSQLFGTWIESINAYLRVYGGVRPVSRARFEDAYFGPLTPKAWIQETLGNLLQLKTGLNVRFGVISNFEAAGTPWMVKFLREHYHGLIDEELIVITGEEGVAKGDGPEVFKRALHAFRRHCGDPVCPVFVDNQVHLYVGHAEKAGIRAFVHYGFAGAESKAQGGFYGREFEEAGLYPPVDAERSLFRALFEKSPSSPSPG
jgi:hypothetical protein